MAVSMNQSCEVKESPETRALRVTSHLPPSRASHRPGVRSPPAAVPERGPGRPEDTRLTKALAQGKTPPVPQTTSGLVHVSGAEPGPAANTLPTRVLETLERGSPAHRPRLLRLCCPGPGLSGPPLASGQPWLVSSTRLHFLRRHYPRAKSETHVHSLKFSSSHVKKRKTTEINLNVFNSICSKYYHSKYSPGKRLSMISYVLFSPY